MTYADLNGDGEVTPGEIIEENNYYPFGLRHKGYNELATENPSGFKYKFGGKELNDELGFEVYDFGARNYDPALGRWMNIDPLGEEFYEWTGYNYALNNPVNNIDPDGMFTLTGQAAQDFVRQLQSDLEQEEMRKLMSGEGDNPSGGGLKDWWKRVTKNWFKSDDDIALEDEYKDRRNKSKKGFWSKFYTNSGFRKGAEWFNNKLLDLTGGFGGLYIYGYGGGGTAGGRKDIEGKHNSIDFDDMLIPGGGGAKTAADLFEYLRFLSGGFTAGANAGSRFGSSDDVVNKKQNYTYETFDIGVPYLSDKYAVGKFTRDTLMRPADYNNTNWSSIKLRDSIRAVNEAKRRNSGRPTLYFNGNGNGYQILE